MSFILNKVSWLWDTLFDWLGLRHKSGHLLILGLDNAGKTTLLYLLQTGEPPGRSFPPTDRPSLNKFAIGKLQFSAYDLGGHEAVRHLWEDYLSTQVNAIIFVIDAADSQRIEEASYELDALISNTTTTSTNGDTEYGHDDDDDGCISNLPIAILLNKCDLVDQAMSNVEICEKLELERLRLAHKAKIEVFRISVLDGMGYQPAFQWIGQYLK